MTMSEVLEPVALNTTSEPEVVWIDAHERAARAQLLSPVPLCGGEPPRLAQAFRTAANSVERRRLITGLLHLTGFATFSYFALAPGERERPRLFLHDAFVPSQYRGDYVRERHDRVDPRTMSVREQHAPLVWDLHTLQRDGIRRGAEDRLPGFLRSMHDDGMLSGVMFELPLPGTSLATFASFTAPRDSRDWMQRSNVEQALLVALAVHAFASPHLAVAAQRGATHALTPFEREILSGVAGGSSDKQIARMLNTTAHNVDYHLRRLRERFQAGNRVELAYVSAKLGLV